MSCAEIRWSTMVRKVSPIVGKCPSRAGFLDSTLFCSHSQSMISKRSRGPLGRFSHSTQEFTKTPW